MTNHNTNNNRDIRELISDLAERQASTQMQLDDLISTANSVLARNSIMNDVLLELRESSEQHQRNFDQHLQNFDQHLQRFDQHQRNFEETQKSTDAALQRLEAILMQLIKKDGE